MKKFNIKCDDCKYKKVGVDDRYFRCAANRFSGTYGANEKYDPVHDDCGAFKPKEAEPAKESLCVSCIHSYRLFNSLFCKRVNPVQRFGVSKCIYHAPKNKPKNGDCTPQRGQCLSKAIDQINGIKQDQHGKPEDSFGIIAEYWETYLKSRGFEVSISKSDANIMLTLFKIARTGVQGYNPDNYVDGAGYLGLAGDFRKVEEEEV